MYYLTFNDSPSGIYYSQVTDVCKFLSEKLDVEIKLVAFVSLRNYFSDRKKIKKRHPNSLVLPMFPGVNSWKKNKLVLKLLLSDKSIIARGIFATWLAINSKKKNGNRKVCFDARGAYHAEFTEYNVAGNSTLNSEIKEIENYCLQFSDYKIAVSNALVNYWHTHYNYITQNVFVIPCTVNSTQLSYSNNASDFNFLRKKYNVDDNHVLICYSGTSSGWHSFKLMNDFFNSVLSTNPNMKILFLTPKLDNLFDVVKKYPDKIIHRWVNPDDVYGYLAMCDYGILIREQSVTNAVASPVKFAEYLNAGLKIIISDGLGDYSDFVKKHNCGVLFSDFRNLQTTTSSDRNKNKELAQKYFIKETHLDKYKKLIHALSISN
jgi:hypothetical protein